MKYFNLTERFVKIGFIPMHDEVKVPQYATEGSSGFDLYPLEDQVVMPGQTRIIKLGFGIEMPDGLEMQVRPRSGQSYKTKLRIPNSPGTIDSDYQEECGVIVENTGSEAIFLTPEKAFAQGVIAPIIQADFIIQDGFRKTKTKRGGGYGSTDKKS